MIQQYNVKTTDAADYGQLIQQDDVIVGFVSDILSDGRVEFTLFESMYIDLSKFGGEVVSEFLDSDELSAVYFKVESRKPGWMRWVASKTTP